MSSNLEGPQVYSLTGLTVYMGYSCLGGNRLKMKSQIDWLVEGFHFKTTTQLAGHKQGRLVL